MELTFNLSICRIDCLKSEFPGLPAVDSGSTEVAPASKFDRTKTGNVVNCLVSAVDRVIDAQA